MLTVSIHAPRVGRDTAIHAAPLISCRFQSTRPVWGATLALTTAAFALS